MKKTINVNFVSVSLISIMFFFIIGMGVIIRTQDESINNLKGYNDYWYNKYDSIYTEHKKLKENVFLYINYIENEKRN